MDAVWFASMAGLSSGGMMGKRQRLSWDGIDGGSCSWGLDFVLAGLGVTTGSYVRRGQRLPLEASEVRVCRDGSTMDWTIDGLIMFAKSAPDGLLLGEVCQLALGKRFKACSLGF